MNAPPGAAFKREIRPLIFQASIQKVQGELSLVVQHPLEGDIFVYRLTPDLVKQMREGLGPGLAVVGADELPGKVH